MKDVQHYVGEYAAKKFEVARNLLPELYRGLQRLQKERDQEKENASESNAKHNPTVKSVQYRAYRTLVRMANSMNRCISKSQAEMSYQLLYESECFLTHQTYTLFMKFPIWAAWNMWEQEVASEEEKQRLREKQDAAEDELGLHTIIASAAAETAKPDENIAHTSSNTTDALPATCATEDLLQKVASSIGVANETFSSAGTLF